MNITAIRKRVAANVRAELARSEVQQEKVADALCLSRSAINRRMKGEVPFTVDEVFIIAGLARTSPMELMGAMQGAA